MAYKAVLDAIAWLYNPYAYLERRAEREGLTFFMRLPGTGRILITGDPRLLAEIKVHPELESGQGIQALRAILGEDSLIMLDGPTHLRHRRWLAPFFHGTEPEHDLQVETCTRSEFAMLEPGRKFSLYSVVLRITLRLIVRTVFGALPACEEDRIMREVETFLGSFSNPLSLFIAPLRRDFGPLSPWGRALRNRDRLLGSLQTILNRYRHEGGKGILGALAGRADGPDGLSDREIVAEMLAILMFGHDTAAAALAWTFTHVYHHQTVLDRLRQELASARDERLGVPFLQACVQESLRLTPVVVHVTRVARNAAKLGPHPLDPGMRIFPCMFLAHRNPRIFDDPREYRPERFMNGQNYDSSYFPFGLSGRICVGRPYALRQMCLILAVAVAEFDLIPADRTIPKPVRRLVLMVPKGGTRMVRLP